MLHIEFADTMNVQTKVKQRILFEAMKLNAFIHFGKNAMTRLNEPHCLDYGLVENGRAFKLYTVQDLATFIARCVQTRREDIGVYKCIRLQWNCIKSSEREVRQVARFIRKKLNVSTTVLKRESGVDRITAVRFVSYTSECKTCDGRVDCLMAERLDVPN